MTSDPAKHSRFQIHLSTVLVIMLAAAILIPIQFLPQLEHGGNQFTRGWPLAIWHRRFMWTDMANGESGIVMKSFEANALDLSYWTFSSIGAIGNACLIVLMLGLIAFVFERLVHHRKQRL